MHMLSIPSPTLRRMTAAVSARRYAIACVCLLSVAAALRFYNLSGNSLWYDEAITSLHSRVALSELIIINRHGIDNITRDGTNGPILYPLALWAVQQVESSNFSVRLVPATASLLTVAALLFLMPRVGVPRMAAFLAALLAALSIAAIEQAQDATLHSVGALGLALAIAGTLQYLRDGRKALLCAALCAAPLLHYGLAPFGVAALGVAALAPDSSAQTLGAPRTYAAALWERLKQRFDLLLPISAFAAGCAISWELTARYQWAAGGWASGSYLAGHYYQGGYDAAAIVSFAISQTWDLAIFHMPPIIAATALAAFGAQTAALLIRRRCDAVALIALFGIGVSICAALMSLYPLGGSRHNLYLGPLIFLAAGGAFYSLAADLAAIARRAWLAPALAATAAGVIALIGAIAIRQDDLYYTDNSIERVLDILDERAREGDAVYVSRWAIPPVAFYIGEKPANYHYEQIPCPGTYASPLDCVPEALDEMFRVFNESRRIWLIHNANVSAPKDIAAYSQEAAQEVAVEEIAADGWHTLYLIADIDGLTANIRKEWLDMYDAVASETPSAVSTYNLYLQDNALRYAKRPCAPADTEARFFLHIHPEDAADLPAWRRQHGFDNLDFDFLDHGFMIDDKCIIRRALPDYPIKRIHAGQFINPNGPVVWEAELPFKR